MPSGVSIQRSNHASQRLISDQYRWPISLAAGLSGYWPDSRRSAPINRALASFRQHQIGQPKQAEELRLVLAQSLVANLLLAEETLDDMKRVLNLGPDAGLGFLDRQQ